MRQGPKARVRSKDVIPQDGLDQRVEAGEWS